VQASAHDKATVYASLNGYRWDDFTPYLYVSKNYGATWQRIGLDLPNEAINVVKEDPKNKDLLYVGTDHGLYASLDGGKTFMLMEKDLPKVAIHDLLVHPRDAELVVGTHGRSIFIADVSQLQQLTSENLAKNLMVFDIKKMRYGNWGKSGDTWTNDDAPTSHFPIYAKSGGTVKIKVKAKDMILRDMTATVKSGINFIPYDLLYDEKMTPQYQTFLNDNLKEKDAKKIELKKADDGKFYLQSGKHAIEFEKDGIKSRKGINN
ncbi:MAG: glycosyl hydrolase, partial [Saprospiraceae bacterium]|nr:glycosyl hydrolase [Saprospiraceae bacterium]